MARPSMPTAGPDTDPDTDFPPATRWNIWDLQANAARLRTAAESWRSLGEGLDGAADGVNDAAGKITDWRGDTADSYRTHRGKITGDLGDTANHADKAATTLDGIAANLETIQTGLSASLSGVSCPYVVDGTKVTFYPASDADVTSIDNAIAEAKSARSDLDSSLSEAVSSFTRLQGKFTDLSNAWANA
ncbi:MAG: WXG100 family type VII secretion target, partial [Micromonosporaceae bacterium]